jgi:hypothetical protein
MEFIADLMNCGYRCSTAHNLSQSMGHPTGRGGGGEEMRDAKEEIKIKVGEFKFA